MKSYNYNDIFATAKLGYAVLPTIGSYNPEDKTQTPIELDDKYIISYSSNNNKKYFNYLGDRSYKVNFNTLSREGLDKYKKELWEAFDEYQKNKPPRYLETNKHTKRKTLSEEEFYEAIYLEYKKIEEGTLGELFRVERKMKHLKLMCQKYNLDYESFYKRMVEEGQYVLE